MTITRSLGAVAHGIKRVYVIVSDYAPGYDAEQYFIKTFKEAGGEVVGTARTPQQETNFSAYMERVLQAKPDALSMFQPAGSPSVWARTGWADDSRTAFTRRWWTSRSRRRSPRSTLVK